MAGRQTGEAIVPVQKVPGVLILGSAAADPRRLVAAWLEGRSPRTREAYGADLEDFRAFIGAQTAARAAELLTGREHGAANELALAYRASLLERGLAPATVNRRLAALRSLTSLARTLGRIPWELEVSNVRAEKWKDTRGPGAAGVRALFVELDEQGGPKSVRDRAILRLLLDLALRRSEVASLDLEHLDVAGGRVQVLRKGKRERLPLELPPRTREALSTWLQVRGSEPGPLFMGFRRYKGRRLAADGVFRMVRALGTRVGLPKLRPHALRHTAITEAVKRAQANGMSLEEVLDFSGHADVRTLMIYRDRERNVQGRLSTIVSEAF